MSKTDKRRVVALVALVVVVAAGCQSEGTLPTPQGEQANKTEDISRDLLSVAAKSDGAVNDLFDDLQNFGGARPPSVELVKEMAGTLNVAIAGKSPSPEASRQLAETLYIVHTARDLNPKQIETLQAETTARVRAAGADERGAAAVGGVALKIQNQITENKRRWYHFF
jgi:hypothetical protein